VDTGSQLITAVEVLPGNAPDVEKALEASDDASFVTATTFLVDGGISAAYVTPD
jgi:hypothetical protein